MYDYVDCVVTEEKTEEVKKKAKQKESKVPAGQRDRRKGSVPFHKNNNHYIIPYVPFSFQSFFFSFLLLADQRANMKHDFSMSPDCVYSFFTYTHTKRKRKREKRKRKR